MNTLVKGTVNTCTFALTTSQLTNVNSPVSLCSSYTLPNAVLNWYWTCTGGWSVTTGTTPTFAIGEMWTHQPSAAFGMANIYTTNTEVGTQASVITTTNSNILLSTLGGSSSTVFQATFSGTFTANSTSGTFSPTASVGGAGGGGAAGTFTGGCTIQ